MKLQFNPDLEYQKRAIASVKDLFLGQVLKKSFAMLVLMRL